MNRRIFLKKAGLGLCGLILAGDTFAQSQYHQRPNIVLIIADDISPDYFACYGNKTVKTSNIDNLAQQGLKFNKAFNLASSCSPSRCSIITVRYHHNIGVPELHMHLPANQITFPMLLKQSDHYTAHDAHRNWDDQLLAQPYSPDQVDPSPFLADLPATRKDLVKYYNEVSRFDHYVGLVHKELIHQGVDQNTIIIVMADNGRPFPRCKTDDSQYKQTLDYLRRVMDTWQKDTGDDMPEDMTSNKFDRKTGRFLREKKWRRAIPPGKAKSADEILNKGPY